MNKEEQFFNELMEKIEDDPSDNKDSLEAIRLILKYLLFDLEATRRERDQLRMILEDQE